MPGCTGAASVASCRCAARCSGCPSTARPWPIPATWCGSSCPSPCSAISLAFLDRDTQQYLELAGLILTVLVVTVVHAGVIARERSDQTLDVLLTTRLDFREILRQKIHALARLRWCMCAVLLLLVLLRYLMTDGSDTPGVSAYYPFVPPRISQMQHGLWFVAFQAALVLLVPALAAWYGLLIGLLIRKPAIASMVALSVLLLWLGGGWLLFLQYGTYLDAEGYSHTAWWVTLTPVSLLTLPMQDLDEVITSVSQIAFGCILAGYLVCWLLLRILVLEVLGRRHGVA